MTGFAQLLACDAAVGYAFLIMGVVAIIVAILVIVIAVVAVKAIIRHVRKKKAAEQDGSGYPRP